MKKVLLALATGFLAIPALAEETAHVVTTTAAATGTSIGGLVAVAAGICLGAAALGGSLGQGKAAAAALEGVARNPAASGKLLLPLILSLAFIEAMSIYALVIAFQLIGKI